MAAPDAPLELRLLDLIPLHLFFLADVAVLLLLLVRAPPPSSSSLKVRCFLAIAAASCNFLWCSLPPASRHRRRRHCEAPSHTRPRRTRRCRGKAEPAEFNEPRREVSRGGALTREADDEPRHDALGVSVEHQRRMKKISKMFDAFMEYVLDEHSERRREGETFVAKDMVDVLMDRGVGALGAPKKTRHLCHGRSITKAAAALRNRRRTTPGTRVAASTRASSRTLTAGSASTPSRGPSAPSPSAIATLVASPHRAVHRRPPRRHPSPAAAPPPRYAAGAPGRAPQPGSRPRTVILP